MIKQWIDAQLDNLTLEDKAYKTGFMLFSAYVIIGILALIVFGNDALNIVANVFIYLIAATFTVAVVVEFWKLILNALKNKYVKWVSIGLVFIVYKFAELKSHEVTHQITSYDPGSFSDATSLLSALYLPYAWFWFAFSALIVLIFFSWLFFPIAELKSGNKFGGAKALGRFVGIFIVFVFTNKATMFFDDPNSFAYKFAKYLVIKSEYHQNKACKNIEAKYFIADVGRGYVSRYNPTTDKFDIYKCNLLNSK